jgi:hypothetical protein
MKLIQFGCESLPILDSSNPRILSILETFTKAGNGLLSLNSSCLQLFNEIGPFFQNQSNSHYLIELNLELLLCLLQETAGGGQL